MSGFTDYHAHFVYGVDDGARTREEMFAMLDAAAAAIILFAIVLTITCINLLVSKKHVHYV